MSSSTICLPYIKEEQPKAFLTFGSSLLPLSLGSPSSSLNTSSSFTLVDLPCLLVVEIFFHGHYLLENGAQHRDKTQHITSFFQPLTSVVRQKCPIHTQSPQGDIRYCLEPKTRRPQDNTQLSKRHSRSRKGPLGAKRGDIGVRRGRLITRFFVTDKGSSTLDGRRDARIGKQIIESAQTAIDDQIAEEIIRQALSNFVVVNDP
eukprot:Gb_03427 [translate_table: standard]